MDNTHLATYVNDHLAGATAGVELIEHLEKTHAGTDLGRFFGELRAEVEADRQTLESVRERLHIGESRLRKLTGWIAERMAELKLWVDDPSGGSLRLFEALEGLSLGIEGKRSLWLALAAAAEAAPALTVADFHELARRAEDQRRRVETHRLEAAAHALVPGSS